MCRFLTTVYLQDNIPPMSFLSSCFVSVVELRFWFAFKCPPWVWTRRVWTTFNPTRVFQVMNYPSFFPIMLYYGIFFSIVIASDYFFLKFRDYYWKQSMFKSKLPSEDNFHYYQFLLSFHSFFLSIQIWNFWHIFVVPFFNAISSLQVLTKSP